MKVNTNVVKRDEWDAAIEEAKSQLLKAGIPSRRVQQLEDVIAVFTDKRDSGEPWPGQLLSQKSSQQHSV